MMPSFFDDQSDAMLFSPGLRPETSSRASTSSWVYDIPGRASWYAGSAAGITVLSQSFPPYSVTSTRIGVPVGNGFWEAARVTSDHEQPAAPDSSAAAPK